MTNIVFTDEQQLIFDELISPTSPIVTIRATAGSSKTTSLVAAISRYKQVFPDHSVRYLVFGALAAAEGKSEFGTNAIVSTLHSYSLNIIRQYYKQMSPKKYETKIPFSNINAWLTWRDVPKSIRLPLGRDGEVLSLVDDYCKSEYRSLDEYAAALKQTDPTADMRLFPFVKHILNTMAQDVMPVTHSFYLKLFHILVMTDTIELAHEDRLLVDEFQDMSGMALDIINAIPADQKVFVGDPNQSIFDFLKLQNGFAKYPDAKVLTLSKSFRVSAKYAPAIQQFLHNHLEPNAVFEGMEYPPDVKCVTKAYLTRTNAKLISKMIELNKLNIPYHLSHKTKLKQMFKLPLAIIYAKPGFDQKDPELKHLQHDIDDWGSLPKSKRDEISLIKYLKEENKHDAKLQSAITLTLNFDRQDIIDAFNHAEDHKSKDCNLQLMTVHTSKGITRDIIELDDDVNEAVCEVMSIPPESLTNSERAELCLGFVSVTRHRHKLINCKFLGVIDE